MDLGKMNMTQLKDKAKLLNLKGFSKLNKKDLINLIQKNNSPGVKLTKSELSEIKNNKKSKDILREIILKDKSLDNLISLASQEELLKTLIELRSPGFYLS